MTSFRLSIVLLMLTILQLASNAQTVDFYEVSIDVSYLPSCGGQSELLRKENNRVSHKATTISWKNCKRAKRKNIQKNDSVETQILELHSLMQLQSFTFNVRPEVIENLKNAEFQKSWLKIDNSDIDSFFTNGSVTLDMREIKTGIEDQLVGVIDGSPYWLRVKFKRSAQDSSTFGISGNLRDRVRNTDIRRWIPFYLVNRKKHIFTSIELVNKYFSDETLENVLLRFVAWRKEK